MSIVGKYSEVFEGVDTQTGKLVVIKILKPVLKAKIKRFGVPNAHKLMVLCSSSD